MNIINLVSAHTGNDAVNHSFELVDGLIGVGLIILIIGGIYLFKSRKK